MSIKKLLKNKVFLPLVPDTIMANLLRKGLYEPRISGLDIRGELPLPECFFFEVRTRCNSSCSFCAASVQNETRRDISMPFALYKKVVDELSAAAYSGRIAYHVTNDPLLFKDLDIFVKYARRMLPHSWIQILTNGRAFTIERGEALVKAGISELTVNIYTDETDLPLPEKFSRFREDVLGKYFRDDEIQPGYGGTRDGSRVFRYNVFSTPVTIQKTSRGGTAPNKEKAKATGWLGFCERPFTQFNITADGRVSKCCADVYFSDPMGNIAETDALDIWRGVPFQEVRKELLEGNREAVNTCRECDYIGVKKTYSTTGKILRFLGKT